MRTTKTDIIGIGSRNSKRRMKVAQSSIETKLVLRIMSTKIYLTNGIEKRIH